MFNSIESIVYKNVAATQGPFILRGGRYAITAIATWSNGNVTLQRLTPDGTTYVTAVAPITANGLYVSDLPSGTYQLAISMATAVYINVVSIENQR